MKIYTESEKRTHVSQWEEQEHQPMSVYSREHGIKYGTFKGWVHRYASSSALGDGAGQHPQPDSQRGFIPVQLGEESVQSPGSARLQISVGEITITIY